MYTLNCKGRLLVLDKPLVMGIINQTPDSFFTGSRHNNAEAALVTAEKMIAEGASILDIGGQSTRPGSNRVDENEEADRILESIRLVNSRLPDAIISVDTYSARVAWESIQAGASIVNDISGGTFDPEMLQKVALAKVPYVCMHIQGNAETMHEKRVYPNLLTNVVDFLAERAEACEKAGINDIILDPGIGFGKSIPENFRLLKELSVLHILNKPVLIGVSRKATIYKTLGGSAAEALNGSTVLHTIALLNGASILRVHDVKEACEAVKLVGELEKTA